MRELFTGVFDGRNNRVMPGVQQALGRTATDLSTYVQKAAASVVWDPLLQRQSARLALGGDRSQVRCPHRAGRFN